jgi:hypothetical protein
MINEQIRWILAGSLVLALAGCEVSVGDCRKDDAGECVDLFPDEEDAGDDEDGGRTDGGRTDGGRADGGGDGGRDGGIDGSSPGNDAGQSGEPLSLEEFCIAQFETAVLWRDALEEYCINDAIAERDTFLNLTFFYPSDDAVGRCIDRLGSSNITFDGTKAAECAEIFVDQFAAPPASFPETGIDLSAFTSTIAHGAASLVQIPECRAALKGKLARDAACTDSFECVSGLRCRAAPGDTSTCQSEVTGGVCLRSSECADGFTCVGSSASGGKTCVASDALPIAGNCQYSFECAEDRVCSSAGKCVAPTPDVICAP